MAFAYPGFGKMLMAKRPAKAAKQQDAFFRHLVGNMRNGVLAIDRDGSLVVINDEARRLFALDPGSDIIGTPYADVANSATMPSWTQPVRICVRWRDAASCSRTRRGSTA